MARYVARSPPPNAARRTGYCMVHSMSKAQDERRPKQPASDRELATTSGLPLQSFLAELVNKTHDGFHQNWRVEAEEVPAAGSFLDMLLVSRPGPNAQIRMAVEVKRFYVKEEQRRARLVFLASRTAKRTINAPAILPCRDPARTHGRSDLPHRLCAGEFYSDKRVHERVAEHCVLESRPANASMDAIASDLLRQMEALSREDVARERYAFVPAIVTNAELRLLRMGDVDPRSGEMLASSDHGDEVPWVCYEKTFSQTGLEPVVATGAKDFTTWAGDRLRTVFIVQAEHFVAFLTRFSVTNPDWR